MGQPIYMNASCILSCHFFLPMEQSFSKCALGFRFVTLAPWAAPATWPRWSLSHPLCQMHFLFWSIFVMILCLYLPARGKNYVLDYCLPTLMQKQKLPICYGVNYADGPRSANMTHIKLNRNAHRSLEEDAVRNWQEAFRMFPIMTFLLLPPSQNLDLKF